MVQEINNGPRNQRLSIAHDCVRRWSTGCHSQRLTVAHRLREAGPIVAMIFLALMMETGLDFPYTREFDQLTEMIEDDAARIADVR